MKRLWAWKIIFIIGVILILFSYDLSRYLSNEYTCVVAGGILSIWSGIGILLEIYHKKD